MNCITIIVFSLINYRNLHPQYSRSLQLHLSLQPSTTPKSVIALSLASFPAITAYASPSTPTSLLLAFLTSADSPLSLAGFVL